METNQYLLERDADGKIDNSKFDLQKVAPNVDRAIKVIQANFIDPLLFSI